MKFWEIERKLEQDLWDKMSEAVSEQVFNKAFDVVCDRKYDQAADFVFNRDFDAVHAELMKEENWSVVFDRACDLSDEKGGLSDSEFEQLLDDCFSEALWKRLGPEIEKETDRLMDAPEVEKELEDAVNVEYAAFIKLNPAFA